MVKKSEVPEIEEERKELENSHFYPFVIFYGESIESFRRALGFYLEFLNKEIKEIEEDNAFSFLVSEENEGSPFFYEKEKTSHLIERFDKACEGKKSPSYDLPFNHGEIRFLKGIMVLYVNHLKNRRNDISRKGNLSLRTLKMLDEYITRCEEEANRGVFNNASPLTLLVEQAIQKEKIRDETGAEKEKDSLSRSVRPSPVVLDSIPIFDAEIRTKCLDVLKKFNDSGENERFDSAVQEATKILEIRLRTLANADEGCSGTALVDFAFAERDTKLVLSRIPAEQKGWYFFFRGVFGSIRNSTHHRFVPFQNIERTLQILGMIDFLLYTLESAERV